ncbi:hypothetical protein ES703_80729 [subsurface metagenome]
MVGNYPKPLRVLASPVHRFHRGYRGLRPQSTGEAFLRSKTKQKQLSWMESHRIWLDTTALSYPSCGRLLTFSLGRGIILVACEVKLLSLSSQRHFPGLTCPGPGRRKQRPGLQKKRTVGCYLTTGGSFVYPFPEMLDRRINTQSRNKSRACLAARGFIV